MSFLIRLLEILDTSAEVPGLYGAFHIVSLVLIAILTFFACRYGKNSSHDKVCNVLLWTAITVIVLEIYKQINYTFRVEDGSLVIDYQWYAFPFQFCSTPMYIGLLAGFFRKGKFHDALCSYLATFALFAGLAVMVYPGDIYVDTIGINLQTTVCHGSMIVTAAYLFATGHVKLEHKTILRALPVFAVAITIAVLLNELAVIIGIAPEETVNMFYVSRHFDSTLPVYSLVHNAVPFPLNLVIYICGFSLIAYLMLLIAMGVHKLTHKSKPIAV